MEKPILFNTKMVQAILNGDKTSTRRPLKKPFEVHPNGSVTKQRGNERLVPYEAPYKVGDTLWVRETWQESECFDFAVKGEYAYLANKYEYELAQEYQIKWRPSIHMPRKAARLFLNVTDVRIERLQEITEDGAREEGCFLPSYKDGELIGDSVTLFKILWDNLYKNWNENPYVWVIEFERAEV